MTRYTKLIDSVVLLSKGPFPIVNFDSVHVEKAEKENKAWHKCTVLCLSHLLT